MSFVRRLVLDVLKPHTPTIVELSQLISELDGVDGVDISLVEIDRKVENVKVTIEGSDVNIDEVERVVGECGGAVHSIDNVSAGRKIIQEVK